MSRILKILFCVSAVFLLAIAAGMSVSAADMGYETLPVSQDRIDEEWDIIGFKVMPPPPSLDEFSSSVKSFDVSKDHNIVMCLSDDKIVVADSGGEVLHYYKFNAHGSFYVRWKNENILLYSERGGSIAEFSLDGEIVDLLIMDEDSMVNNKLWNEHVRYKNKMVVDNYTYRMAGSFWGDYPRLLKIDEQGNVTKVYDVSTEKGLWNIVIAVIFVSTLTYTVIGVIIQQKKRMNLR
ncbi:MAG: hypothetical protein J6L81_09645 [Clostridia bacterium]|nr:hypothetical protein [Clostridia bacterium]